jgi:hypothetical protein
MELFSNICFFTLIPTFVLFTRENFKGPFYKYTNKNSLKLKYNLNLYIWIRIQQLKIMRLRPETLILRQKTVGLETSFCNFVS